MAAAPPKAVYVMTNASSGNSILVYSRATNGTLAQIQEISTQGLGSGGTADPLGSQDALTLSGNGQFLLAVNAGSNQVTSFTVTSTGLKFASIVSSGGTFPVSVAIHGGLAFVVNQSGTPNIASFRIASNGVLTPLSNTQDLPGGATSSPGDIKVTPDGKVILVTEKGTNQIDLFTPGGSAVSVPSNSMGPFGMAFGANATLLVAEAPSSSVSSYSVVEGTPPSLQVITPSLGDMGGTSCWIVTSPTGDFAYVINSNTRNISSYAVSSTGALSVFSADAGNMGKLNGPIDAALSHDGRFLYVLSSSTGLVMEFRVSNGTLTRIGDVTGIPVSLQGIAAW